MANLDLDIDFNGLDNDILTRSSGSKPDIYPRIVRYASKKGVNRRQVDDIMLEVAGGYSNFDEATIKKEAETFCEAEYEACVQKNKGEFGDCGNQLQPCKDKFIQDKKNELKKSKSGNFWEKVKQGINAFGQVQAEMQKQQQQQGGSNTGNDFRNDNPLPPAETRILGMKPLVFTVVALGTVTTLAIVTVMLMRKGKK